MDQLLVLFAVMCFGVAAILAVLEIFLPSGGALGFGAAVAVVAGIVLLFMFDTTWGLVGAIVSVTALPVVVGFGIKYWPQSPVARFVTLRSTQRARVRRDLAPRLDDESMAEDDQPQMHSGYEELAQLVGKTGKAATDLRPSGMCVIDGKRMDCMADRGMIDRGTPVKVVLADATQVRVTPIREQNLSAGA